MNTIAHGVDYKSAPPDYAALHEMYYPYVVNLVAKSGINENNKEDVASEIFLRLMENDILADFDPTLVFEYEGQLRPARFKSFLSRLVVLYIRGHKDKQKRLAEREYQICDMQVGDFDNKPGFSGAHTWADLYGPPGEDHADIVIDVVQEEQEAAGVCRWLSQRPRRSHVDACDLVDLYLTVREQVLTTGNYDVQQLRERYGIGTTTMHTWLWWLKQNLAVLYGRPMPKRRPRRVPGKEQP